MPAYMSRIAVLLLLLLLQVIWRKANDASPLTIGLYPFAADARISVDNNQRHNEWTLLIQDVRTSDEGLYICQVSTKDASEHMFTVQLIVKSTCRLRLFFFCLFFKIKKRYFVKERIGTTGQGFVAQLYCCAGICRQGAEQTASRY